MTGKVLRFPRTKRRKKLSLVKPEWNMVVTTHPRFKGTGMQSPQKANKILSESFVHNPFANTGWIAKFMVQMPNGVIREVKFEYDFLDDAKTEGPARARTWQPEDATV